MPCERDWISVGGDKAVRGPGSSAYHSAPTWCSRYVPTQVSAVIVGSGG